MLAKMDVFLKMYKIKTIYDLLAQLSALQFWTAKHFPACPACSHRVQCRWQARQVTQCTQPTTTKWLKRIKFPLSRSGSFFKNTIFKTCWNHRCDVTTNADGLILILRVFLNWSWNLLPRATSPSAVQHTGSGSWPRAAEVKCEPLWLMQWVRTRHGQPFWVTLSSFQQSGSSVVLLPSHH